MTPPDNNPQHDANASLPTGVDDTPPPQTPARLFRLWFPPIIWIIAIFLASSWSGPDEEIPFWFPGLDKIIHAGVYAVLAQFFFMAFRFERRASLYLAATLACLCTTLYGIADEWHQSFTPGRTADALDVFADFIGGSTAFFSAFILQRTNGVETWIRQKLVPASKR